MVYPSTIARPVMPTLLVVHHTVSPALQELLEAVRSGTSADRIEGALAKARPTAS